MSPNFLYSSYMRYKAGTDAVATWLLNTAKERGYDTSSSVEAADTAIKGPRLKGKARTLARSSHSAAGKQGKSNTQGYRIKVDDFIYLAQYIAKLNNPRVNVPHSFVLQLRQAIKARKSHQARYEKTIGRITQSVLSDCGHAYFIRTLESVMEILRPIMQTSTQAEDARANPSASPLANMFERLVVEETPEIAGGSQTSPRSNASMKVHATVEDTGIMREQEALIASTFLSRDLHRLRNVVQRAWKAYHEGNTGLVAASITTNTAIDFCRRLQEDFDKEFPGQEKWHEQTCMYCVFLEDSETHDVGALCYDEPCLTFVHQFLPWFMNQIKDSSKDDMLGVSPAFVKPYLQAPLALHTALYSEDKLCGHCNLLMSILPEYAALIRARPEPDRFQAEHEIIRAMRHLLSHKTLTLWVTFAFQVLLDTRHILREDVSRGFDDLRLGANLIKSNITSVLKFHTDIGVTKFASSYDQPLNGILGLIRQWTERDHVRTLSDRENSLGDPPVAEHIPEYYLLKRDPLWCGMLLYSFRMMVHQGAINMTSSWGCILAAAHLYNSLRQPGLLTSHWEDMESVISMHGAENLYVGKIPTTYEDCVKRFALAIGVPASKFARNQRQQKAVSIAAKGRRLKNLAPVSWLFVGRYCEGNGRTSLGPEDVIKVFRQKALEEGDEAYNTSTSLGLCGIIEMLRQAIEHESSQVTFNHFELHILCWKMLRQLHTALGATLPDLSERYRDDENLPGIVLDILMASTPGSLVASKASEIVAGLITRTGDVAQRDKRELAALAASRWWAVFGSDYDQSDASLSFNS